MTAGARSTERTTRTEYFDVLRGVAIVCVLILHAAAARWPYLEPGTPQWQTLNVYDSLVRFCVPIFFMISGALFLDSSRGVTPRTILRHSLPRIVVAYIVWSGVFALFTAFVVSGYQGGWSLLSAWVTGHYHLWFLPALMALYIVTPILRRICESRALARYFVVLAAVFAVVAPALGLIPRFGDMITPVLAAAQLQLVLGYSIYFVLGHLTHNGMFARVTTAWVIVAGIVAFAVTVFATSIRSLHRGIGDTWFYGYLTPNVVVMSVVVFILAKRWGETHRLGPRASRVVMLLSTCSFGIYLVHPLFQETLALVGVSSDSSPAIVSVPLIVVLVLLPSLAVAWSLKRLPAIGRYLA